MRNSWPNCCPSWSCWRTCRRSVGQVNSSPGSSDNAPTTNGGSHPLAGVLGDYRIIREIGRGGMGVVYEAQQLSLDRRVALKILPFAGMLDQRQLQRFKNEAQAAAGLHHPHIVPVYFVGCEKAVHFYAMQYIEGQTLARVIDELKELQTSHDGQVRQPVREPADSALSCPAEVAPDRTRSHVGESRCLTAVTVPKSQITATDTTDQTQALLSTHGAIRNRGFFRSVARLGIQAAQALEYAHQSGVIHRDIKPSNLLIDLDGNLWISDFGLAQTRAGPDITMTGDVLGTLRYMSPEQAEGNRRILDHHTDIYSLGVTLYETLSLHPPFDADDRHQLIHQIIDGDHRPLRRVNSAIPQDLETIVLKAMATEPETRYATAQELADDLQRFIDDKPIQAHRPNCAEPGGEVVPPPQIGGRSRGSDAGDHVDQPGGQHAAGRPRPPCREGSAARSALKRTCDWACRHSMRSTSTSPRIGCRGRPTSRQRIDRCCSKALQFYEAFAEGNAAEPTPRVRNGQRLPAHRRYPTQAGRE